MWKVVSICSSLINVVTKVLNSVGKSWEDIIALALDSADYMRQTVKNVCAAETTNALHLKNIPHLTTVTVDCTVFGSCVAEAWSIVIKSGPAFKHANRLFQEYHSFTEQMEWTEVIFTNPPVVIFSRWFSFWAVVMWGPLTNLMEKLATSKNKAAKIRAYLLESICKSCTVAGCTSTADRYSNSA